MFKIKTSNENAANMIEIKSIILKAEEESSSRTPSRTNRISNRSNKMKWNETEVTTGMTILKICMGMIQASKELIVKEYYKC